MTDQIWALAAFGVVVMVLSLGIWRHNTKRSGRGDSGGDGGGGWFGGPGDSTSGDCGGDGGGGD